MVSYLLIALAVAIWPSAVNCPVAVGRSDSGRTGRRFGSVSWIPVAVGCSGLVVSAYGGLLVGLSSALVTATISLLVRSEMRRRRQADELAALLAATRTLAREVRSGAAPTAAILATAAVHHGSAGSVLQSLAIGVSGDRGSHSTGDEVDRRAGLAVEITDRLTRGWALSARYGVPWAALVEAVSADLADRVRATSERSAQVAGPRVSGYVLAVMPALGVMLGVGMGAHPCTCCSARAPGT